MDNYTNPLENSLSQCDSFDALLKMDNFRIGRILSNCSENLRGADGAWNFTFEDVDMMLFTDEVCDRMRVIAHIDQLDESDTPFIRQILEANFLTALDVRYAVYQDALWAVYTRPLASMSRTEVVDSLKQVATLVQTTGTSFSSVDPDFYEEAS